MVVDALSVEDIEKSIEDARLILRKLENMRDVMLNGLKIDVSVISSEKEAEFEELMAYSNAGKEKLLLKSRSHIIALERHLVCWLAKYELGIHEKSIAYLLGGRERSTMYNSFAAAEAMIKYPSTVPHYCEKLFNRVLKFKEKNAKSIKGTN